ncbi:MAG: hypothetical protein ACRDX9_07120 [Acidimicrobiia bacterium]
MTDRRLRKTKTIAAAVTLALALAACEADDPGTDPTDPLDPGVTTTLVEEIPTTTVAG